MVQVPSDELVLALTQLKATGALLDAVKVRLYTNSLTLGPDTVLADLTQATFDGYAAVGPVVWGAPIVDPSGNAILYGASAQFTMTGLTVSETVMGWYLTIGSGAGTELRAVEAFAAPIPMSAINDGIIVVPAFGLPGPVEGLVTGP